MTNLMSIRETDLHASAAPASTLDEETAFVPTVSNEWSVFEPGKPPLPSTPRNQPETDLEIGSARMSALLPFALALLGRPYQVWDLATGRRVERNGRLSIKDHVNELVRHLGCGSDFIYKCISTLCDCGPENVKISSFLKGAPSGGKGGCRTGANDQALFVKAIDEICMTRGLRPGREKALKEIRTYLAAHGWSGKLPSDKTLRKHSKAAWVQRARADSYERDHLFRVIAQPAESLGLMSMVQLDTTTFTDDEPDAVRVVNDLGQDLGPANVIFGIMGANRGVWTFCPFVGAANSFLAGLSIKRGLLSKDPLLQEYGIQGVYPYSGKVGEIRHDNGSEFNAEHLRSVLTLRGIKFNFDESSPVKTPHYRGKEERFNRTAHKLFKDFLDSPQGMRYLRPVHGNKKAKGIRLPEKVRRQLPSLLDGELVRRGDNPDSK
jgi:hypothetical protein